MADLLDLAIAQGPGRVDFSPLSKLLGDFTQGAKDRATYDSLTAFRGGLPTLPDGSPNLSAMAQKYFQFGDVASGTALANLGYQRDLQRARMQPEPLLSPSSALRAPAAPATVAPSFASRVAQAESSNDPNAGAPTLPNGSPASSARGLFQFTEPTWLGLMQKYPQLGLTPEGRNDTQQQQRAFDALTRENSAALSNAGIDLTPGNLYVAHVLGAPGAINFLQGLKADPNKPAASLVGPAGVNANRYLFFGPDKRPVSAADFYQNLTNKVADQPAATEPAAPQQNPILTGLVPPEWRGHEAEYVTALQNRAAQLAVIPQYKDRAKVLEDRAKAIIQWMQPSAEMKQAMADRRPGESIGAYQSRLAGETEYAREDAKTNAKRFADIQDAGMKAMQELPQLDMAKRLMSDPNYYSGFGEKYALLAKRAAVALGIGDPNQGAPIELVKKIVSNSILSSIRGIVQGTGQVRAAELTLMQQAAASPENTVAANKAVAEIAIRAQQRAATLAQMARDYTDAHNGRLDSGFYKTVANWDRGNPMFTKDEISNYTKLIGGPPANATAVAAPPTVSDRAAYDALPSGASFIGPDGKSWRKP